MTTGFNKTAGTIKVLMRNRPNALTQRGGDTVVMERIAENVRARGIEVTIDLDNTARLADYDLVHLFNFALPDLLRQQAQEVKSAGKPFVVSAMLEDIPTFHNQSIHVANMLQRYVSEGQRREWYRDNRVEIGRVPPCPAFENSWAAANAAAVFVTGASEERVLKAYYPSVNAVRITVGIDQEPNPGPELFIKKYGIKDFVLCVGRLESRKNQLMLLKALEDSDLTVVLAAGGFTYQPGYEQHVRNFKRRGRTLVLDKLPPEMLASAYAAARVHCLPSWYELPGLVSLEAALRGCNVVAADNGTAFDYFEDKIFYCDPWSAESVKNAVIAAFHTPTPPDLKSLAASFTWERTVKNIIDTYATVSGKEIPAAIAAVTPTWTDSATDAETTLVAGEEAAKERDLPRAEELLRSAIAKNPQAARAHKALGAVLLAQSRVEEAKASFGQALTIDPNEARALSGMGMCCMMEKNHRSGYTYLVKAMEVAPAHLTTLMQLVECSYVIGRFDDLERFLRQYVAENPDDGEMLFCHAGSLYKLGRYAEARSRNDQVLSRNPTHLGAGQLRDILNQQAGAASNAPTQTAPVGSTAAQKLTIGTPITPAAATPAMPTMANMEQRIAALEEEKRQKNYEPVKQGCTEILNSPALSPDIAERARLLQAECSVLTGDLRSAATLYDAVLSTNPNSARAMCGRGALSANANDWSGARDWFQKALNTKPRYDVALAGLGLTAHVAGENHKAWDYYTQAVSANAENQRALLGLIEIGYQLGKLAEVETAIRSYLDMHPADLDLVYSLAGCFYAQGKYADAIGEINKILLFKPDHTRAIELKQMIEQSQSARQHYAPF
ncbi:MAG: tetratricopeptide repeat protein [Oligoflexia bacterium]|nr:tetratricopeptide repeat protein [Oligoflexia bacterium]